MPIRKKQRKHFKMGADSSSQTYWVNREFAAEMAESDAKAREKEAKRKKAKEKAEARKQKAKAEAAKRRAESRARESRDKARKRVARRSRLGGNPATAISLALLVSTYASLSETNRRRFMVSLDKAAIAPSDRSRIARALERGQTEDHVKVRSFDAVAAEFPDALRIAFLESVEQSDSESDAGKARVKKLLSEGRF